MSVYLVTSRVPYRGHPPGAVFEARLQRAAEERALRSGAVQIVQQSSPALKPGSWTLPRKRRH